MSIPLAVIEEIIDASGIAEQIEGLLPYAVRDRQLTARTLLVGMHLTLDDGRPAHLTRVRQALISLPGPDQERLGVTMTWKTGPHQLTYRQVEHTHRLITKALGKQQPDGAPSGALQSACDTLLEASIPDELKHASTALAGDWTDVETWSRPPRHGDTQCADREASWGHRNSNLPGPRGEMFFGYYLSLAVMTREENGPPVPELARRMTAASCNHDPVRALVPVLAKLPAAGIPLGDFLADSGTPTVTPPHGPSPCAKPARSSSRTCTRQTAAPAAHTTAPSSPTDASTAPPPPHRCSPSARCRPARQPRTPPRTTSKPPSSPATNCPGTPATTLTATTASPAPPPPARSAAPSAPSQ